MVLRRVVVGVDGSAGSVRALSWAAAASGISGCEIIAVHALGLLTQLDGRLEPSVQHREEISRRLEQEWCRPILSDTVSWRSEVMDGNPVSALLEAAAQFDADTIVVGKRGLGGFPALQLGSTSQQLAQHAEHPLVIVPSS
jgi:nucleotide-binding universal stress UspA family protein